jgi:plasmid stabilization system protein ParE
MADVRRSPQAETDFDGILDNLQRRNLATAKCYATAFYDQGNALSSFPEIGRLFNRLVTVVGRSKELSRPSL